jgi:hypothetical protein
MLFSDGVARCCHSPFVSRGVPHKSAAPKATQKTLPRFVMNGLP